MKFVVLLHSDRKRLGIFLECVSLSDCDCWTTTRGIQDSKKPHTQLKNLRKLND